MGTFGKRIDPSESIGRVKIKKDTLEEVKGATSEAVEPVTSTGNFAPRDPVYRIGDVILSENTQRQIETLQSRIKYHSVLYDDWGLKNIDPQGRHVAVNFYGPPGTGKTMCAEALASEMGKQIIDVSYAEIESKFVGETGKNIRLAFKTAAEADAVLFFDEADSILGRRMTNVTQAADHAVNVARAVMLKELDAFKGIVIFATNLSRNFDGAFVRRILQHIQVPLPDHAGRTKLLKKMLSSSVPGRDKLELSTLADQMEGFSGGDIKNVVILALSRAVSRIGDKRKVEMDDMISAIKDTHQAKLDVGQYEKTSIELL